jgi:hypothetical protein
MNESESASLNEEVWDYVKEHPRLLGLPMGNNAGLDILGAMSDIHKTIQLDPKAAADMLTLLAGVILAATQGDGEEILNEVIVAEAMHNFDKETKDILGEK